MQKARLCLPPLFVSQTSANSFEKLNADFKAGQNLLFGIHFSRSRDHSFWFECTQTVHHFDGERFENILTCSWLQYDHAPDVYSGKGDCSRIHFFLLLSGSHQAQQSIKQEPVSNMNHGKIGNQDFSMFSQRSKNNECYHNYEEN